MTNTLESKILAQYSLGKKNREISRALNIHHNTVSYWLKKNKLKANYFGQPIDMVSDTQARCRKCNLIKLLSEYQFGRKGKLYEYRFSYCNDCHKKQGYLNLNSDINKFLADRFSRMKRRALKDNIPFSISKEQFINQFHIQDGLCFYTDTKMVCKVGKDLNRDSMSIDRIIPDKGYINGNVVFATHRINTCKNDLSINELAFWMPEFFFRIKIKSFSQTIEENNVKLLFSWTDNQLDDTAKYLGGYFNSNDKVMAISANKYFLLPDDKFFLVKKHSAEEVFYTMLHEFGHFESFQAGYHTTELKNDWLNPDKTTILVYEEEERAWKSAENKAKLLGAYSRHNQSIFNSLKRECLANYKEKADDELQKLLYENK